MLKLQKETRASDADTTPEDTRARILSAAIKLLTDGGRDAITTRAVAEAAGVQPPVLYRHFKGKDAMLDALAEHGFLAYINQKRRQPPEPDPLEALRSGWDRHVDFGLKQPELYLLMFAQPRHGKRSSAAEISFSMLRQHIRRVAEAGRLLIPEEQAVSLFHAAAVGVVLVLLNSPAEVRDMAISRIARDAALSVMTGSPSRSSSQKPETAAALTLLAALNHDSPFSIGERSLLKEWLNRIAVQKPKR
jgi:AcrR family transcriptional regulator